MLEAMLHAKINGPTLGSPNMETLVTTAVQAWLNKKNRNKKGFIPAATAEGALQITPKEVADVSVQTSAVEEDVAGQKVENQVEEVSTLLDFSPADSDDYDSAFESDTTF